MALLLDLGLDPALLAGVDQTIFLVGRVTEEQKNSYRVLTEAGRIWARAAGRLLHAAATREALPAVGDFVLLRRDTVVAADDDGDVPAWSHVEGILPRRSVLKRKAAGGVTVEQILAANVDVVFVVNSLNRDLSERRIERYLLAIWESGAVPVLLLSKADLVTDRDELLARVATVAMGAATHAVSTVTGEGLDVVRGYLGRGRTAALIGSSGVGKSTLLNTLLGSEALATQAIRAWDDKGRHTTTHRSLWLLPDQGGVLLDTPGMREFMPWDAAEAVGEAFADVEQVAQRCRFADCTHRSEPDCAVREALASGALAAERLESYGKLQKEQAYLARKQDVRLAAAERKKWKQITKTNRARYRAKG